MDDAVEARAEHGQRDTQGDIICESLVFRLCVSDGTETELTQQPEWWSVSEVCVIQQAPSEPGDGKDV
jgi:hypothetical protein